MNSSPPGSSVHGIFQARLLEWGANAFAGMDRLPTPVFLGFPCGSAGKESCCKAGDLGSIPRLGRSPRDGKGYPLQYSDLENSMDDTVHGVAKSWTGLSDFISLTFLSHVSFWDPYDSNVFMINIAPRGL